MAATTPPSSRAVLGLTLALLLGLAVAAPGAAQYAKDTVTYQVKGSRTAIAATGADIFETGHDYVLVEATAGEAAALKQLGFTLVLNFAPIQLKVRDRVKVKSVDLRINLESLSFYLKNVEDGVIP